MNQKREWWRAKEFWIGKNSGAVMHRRPANEAEEELVVHLVPASALQSAQAELAELQRDRDRLADDFNFQFDKAKSLEQRLQAAEVECAEQARLNGMGAQRELALETKLRAAEGLITAIEKHTAVLFNLEPVKKPKGVIEVIIPVGAKLRDNGDGTFTVVADD